MGQAGEHETLGDALRRRRRELRLTQAEAAQRLGTRQQNVANWETGMVPRPGTDSFEETMRGLATFFGSSIPEVLRMTYAPWAEQEVETQQYESELAKLRTRLHRVAAILGGDALDLGLSEDSHGMQDSGTGRRYVSG